MAKNEKHNREFEESLEGKLGYMVGGCSRKKRGVGGWRVFWGVLFLLAAAGVIASALGVITFGVSIGWLIFCVVLFAIAITCLVKLNWFGFFIPVAGILTILITQTNYIPALDGHIGTVWIVSVLASIGFSILFHRRTFWKTGSYKRSCIENTDSSEVNVEVNFGSAVKYVTSEDFKQARIECNFGGAVIDFNGTKIKGDGAIIHLDCSFSGVKLFIPKEWNVEESISKTASSINYKNGRRQSESSKARTVVLAGELNMSGLEITYI